MISIIVCDDHELVRKGICQIIESQSGFEILDDVASGEELIKVLRKRRPDVVILDVSLPGRSGLEVLKQIRLLYPGINVLVLSMYAEEQFAIRMIKAGAAGYLHKDSSPEILCNALNTIAKGKKYVSPGLAPLLFNEVVAAPKNQPLHHLLSDREFEVMLLLGSGKEIGQIADLMSLSIKTISTYKTRICDKLGLKNISGITRYIIENDLLQQA